jgi:hypothetical protein
MWYYGRRTATGCHPSEFWSKYFTSSEHVKNYVNDNGPPTVMFVRKVFSTIDDCKSWETRVLRRMNAARSSRFLNGSNGDAKFDATGKVSVIDVNGNTLQVDRLDPRYLSGELVSTMKGKAILRDVNGNTHKVNVDDPRRKSGELVGTSHGKVIVMDHTGKTFQVSLDDPRYLSGELVPHMLGKSVFRISDGTTEMMDVTDDRVISGEAVHINKGKLNVVDCDGNVFKVSVDDPRYLSGELKSHLSGRVFGVTPDGVTVETVKGDPRFKTGELISYMKGKRILKDKETGDSIIVTKAEALTMLDTHQAHNKGMTPAIIKSTGKIVSISIEEFHANRDIYDSTQTGKVVVKDSTGKRMKVTVDDPRYLSGELVGLAKGTVAVKDKQGNVLKVSIDDPRYISGELVGVTSGMGMYVDSVGRQTRADHNDPRVLSGELVKYDLKSYRANLRLRPEVVELKAIAVSKNIKLSPYWEWSIDLAPHRERIVNGPSNVSYASRAAKKSTD